MKIFINHLKCAADNLQQAGITFLAKNIYDTNQQISKKARNMTLAFTFLVLASSLSIYFLQVAYWVFWLGGMIALYMCFIKPHVHSFFTLRGQEQHKLQYHLNDLACMLSHNDNQQHLLDFFKALHQKYQHFPENEQVQNIIRMINQCQFTEAALALSNMMHVLEKYLSQPAMTHNKAHLVAVKNI